MSDIRFKENEGVFPLIFSLYTDKSELKAMAKQFNNYWFVQFDFPDENGKPFKSSRGKMFEMGN